MRIGVVTDERIAVRDGRLVSRVPLTGHFLELLSMKDNNVQFLCREWRGSGGAEVEVSSLFEVTALPDWHLLTAFYALPRVFQTARRWMKGRRTVVIVLPTLSGLAVGLMAVFFRRHAGSPPGAQIVTINRSFGSNSVLLRFSGIARFALSLALKCADAAYGAINRTSVVALFVSESLAAPHTMENAVIAPEIDWAALESFERTEPRRNRVLFIGRLELEKNPRLALEAFAAANLPNFEICFVGEGSLRFELTDAARSWEIDRVTFTGLLPHREVLQLMATSQLVLIPSLTEAFGLVAFEATALGASVIHSGRGGLPEAVGDSDLAHQVDGLSASAWALALQNVLNTARPLEETTTKNLQALRSERGWKTLREVLSQV